jgi:orotidine-5'-phosphate decarboxylase
MVNPVLVALDVPTAEEATRLARRLDPHVGGFKVGLELLLGPGPGTVAALASSGKPVFADTKLHDIPNTVRKATAQIASLGARWITVHASGGRAMMEAAVEGAAEGARGRTVGVLAVTLLTSIDAAEAAAIGYAGTPGKQVARLSRMAQAAGVEGVVCSVRELGDVHQVAPDLLRVTPGIRPAGTGTDDQARVATPREALERGADHLVVGRAITAAPDPVGAAADLAAEIMDFA